MVIGSNGPPAGAGAGAGGCVRSEFCDGALVLTDPTLCCTVLSCGCRVSVPALLGRYLPSAQQEARTVWRLASVYLLIKLCLGSSHI